MESLHSYFRFLFIAILTVSANSQNLLEIQPHGSQIIRSVGSSLALTCKPNVKNPEFVTQLEWRDPQNRRIDNTNQETDLYIQKLPEGTGAVLIFSKIKENMAGTYTCLAKYDNTEEMKAAVNVQTIVEIKWIDAPENQFPKLGENYRIRCKVEANPAPIVEWIRNGETITTNDRYVIDPKGLLIKNIKESDDGLYICRAVVISTGEIQIRNIKVEVQIPPKIEKMDDIEVIEGEEASVLCKARGKPPPVYTWIKDITREDLSKTNGFTVKENQGLLIIHKVKFNDNSNYTCAADNQAGRDEVGVQIKVLSPPRITELLNVTAPKGVETKIICKATGRPTPSITFRKLSSQKPFEIGEQKDDNRIILEQELDFDKGESSGILIIRNLDRSDDGLYECIASNQIRKAYLNGHITVQFPPTFERMKNYPPVWTWGGKPANLSCIAESIPNATIEWKWQNMFISQNTTNMWKIGKGPQSFLIVNTYQNERFLGKYECIATNTLGTNSTFIEVRQATPPNPVQQVRVNSITATTIKFNIVDPSNFHGLPLRKYLVQYQTDRERDWSTAKNYTWTVGAPYILEKLVPEMTYNFRFAAINDVGMGGWGGNQQIRMPPRSAPAEPKILLPNYNPNQTPETEEVLFSNHADYFELRWNVPNDNGEAIDSYIIRYCVTEKINGEWRDDLEKCQEVVQSFQYTYFNLSSLQPDTVYKIELKARNAIGDSTPAQIKVKTARGLESMTYEHEAVISSSLIIGIVVAAVIVILLIVDITCCCINQAGILAFLLEKIKSKPTIEDDPRLGREEKEPLQPGKKGDSNFINSNKRNISVEFDGQKVYSRPGDVIIGKNSAV